MANAVTPQYEDGNRTVLCGEHQINKQEFRKFLGSISGTIQHEQNARRFTKSSTVVTVFDIDGKGNNLKIAVSDTQVMSKIMT